jgi:hypothetical protein
MINMPICKVCKRPLKNYTSVKLGIGPVCRCREGIQPELFNNHANYNIVNVTNSYIFVKDVGYRTQKTITNDVDYVLSELKKQVNNMEYKRLFYMDSEGSIDEIVHSGNRFVEFRAGHEGVNL